MINVVVWIRIHGLVGSRELVILADLISILYNEYNDKMYNVHIYNLLLATYLDQQNELYFII